jgi:hypothetical protein
MSNSAFSQSAAPSSFADLTGVPDDNAALAAALALKADAVPTYIANISQAGTSAPTVDSVIINTAGITPTYGYAATGTYTLTSVGSFISGKVVSQLLNANDGDTSSFGAIGIAIRADNDTINLLVVSLTSGLSVDGSLTQSQLVIQIYP